MNDENIIQKLSDEEFTSVRRIWNENEEKWYFSVVDIIGILAEQPTAQDASKYWNKVKTRLLNQNPQLSSFWGQLKLESLDGKQRKTDVADMENIFRIIQEIPSRKAEPVKRWISNAATEKWEALHDPEKAEELINKYRQHQIETWKKQGKSNEWIERRLKGIEKRNRLTYIWSQHGITNEFGMLTNTCYATWSGMTAQEYRINNNVKEGESLRDSFSEYELIISDVTEMVTADLTIQNNAQGFNECNFAAKEGGSVGRSLRDNIEEKLGRSVISTKNQLHKGDN